MSSYRLVALFAVALVLLGTIGAFVLTLRLAEASWWVEHTISVQARSSELLALAVDAETGQRGYLLTKDMPYLAPLELARAELPKRVQDLRQLTLDNAEQQRSIDAVEQLVQSKLAEIDVTIDLAKVDRDAEALALVRENSGKALMDAVRVRIAEIQKREETLLKDRTRDAQRTGNWLLAAIVTTLLSGVLLALTILAMLRRQIDELETQVAERTAELQVMTQELDHRSSNLLAVMQSIVNQTARSSDSVEDMKQGVFSRLQGLARSKNVLLGRDASGGSLHKLVRNHITPLADERQFTIEGADAVIAPAQVQALGLALHELATNAAKYGALSTPSGTVLVRTTVDAGNLSVEWQERGGPPVSPPSRQGFGANVIGRITEANLGGQVSHEFPEDGVRWKVEFPLSPMSS